MRIVGIIPARLENTRLPGKVLMDLWGMSMLERVVARAYKMQFLDDLLVVFPYGGSNTALRDLCEARKWQYIRGSENILGNLLTEFYEAALATEADIIVRIDSDDPFVDPILATESLSLLIHGGYDFVSSKAEGSGFPVGVGVEVFTKEALIRTYHMTEKHEDIRNVTPFMYKNPEIFKIYNMNTESGDYSHIRLTVDTLSDLELARALYHYLSELLRPWILPWGEPFGWRSIVRFMEQRPELLKINSHVQQEYVR